MSNVLPLVPGSRLPASLNRAGPSRPGLNPAGPPGSDWTTLDYACAAMRAGFLLAWAPALAAPPLLISAFMAPRD